MTNKAKILIVDDNVDTVELLTKRFHAEGYDTSEAYDGEQALQQVVEYQPDIILLDIMMPKIDGYEVSKRLKSYDNTKHIPIIMLSAKARVPDKIKGLDLGADDYIVKPFDYRELSQRVKYWVTVKVEVEGRLTKIRQLEKELIQSERLAAVGQTVASLAHYVKNILFGLKGGVYLVNEALKEDETDSLKDGWDLVESNMGRISGLVLDLLEYSRERKPEYEKCFPNEIADDVCKLTQESAKEYSIEIIKDFDPSMGEAVMDPKGIHRCLLNLVSNAIDACIYDSNEEKKWVVRVRTILEDDGMVKFEVSDNGCGMDEEVKKKLFTSVFTTKEGRGTGLGLLNTQKIVQEHGGTMTVNSQLGQGSTFTIRLPYKDGATSGATEKED
ncbi:MAG: response regulator [Deltaproteobacteria bacterium]|nr:response regulator [Deltaproteobacteria bacterium]